MEHPWGLKDVEEKSLRRSKPRKRKEAESKAPPKPPGVNLHYRWLCLRIMNSVSHRLNQVLPLTREQV